MASSHVANISAYNTGCNIKRAAIRRASYRRERTRKGRARTAAHLQCIALAMGVLQRLRELEVPFHARLKYTHARTHTRSAQHPLTSKQAHNNLCKQSVFGWCWLIDIGGGCLCFHRQFARLPSWCRLLFVCLLVCRVVRVASLFELHSASSILLWPQCALLLPWQSLRLPSSPRSLRDCRTRLTRPAATTSPQST